MPAPSPTLSISARAALWAFSALYQAMSAIDGERRQWELLAISGEDYDVWHAGPNDVVHSDGASETDK